MSIQTGRHQIKVGGAFKSFPIEETFRFGLTDPELNNPLSDDFNPDLLPFDLTRRGRTDCPEDACTDHGADRQHDQVARAQGAPQTAGSLGLSHQGGNRLPLEELGHKRGFYQSPVLSIWNRDLRSIT